MKKIAAAIVITALVLGAIYGAVSGAAAALSLSGVDDLKGDKETIESFDTGAKTCAFEDMTVGCTVE